MTEQTRLSRELLVAFLGEMQLIRRFEEKVEERFRAGDLAGFLHACLGQEAVAVGVCRALADGDVIASTHRAHGHVLANGTLADEEWARLDTEAHRVVDASVEFARVGTDPNPADALKYVYAEEQ